MANSPKNINKKLFRDPKNVAISLLALIGLIMVALLIINIL